MWKVSIGAILAAAALMLFAVPAHAQFGGGGLLPELPDPGNKPPSEAYCTQYAAEAVQLAQQAGGLKCGFNANAPQWSTNAASQKASCSATTLNAANGQQSSRRSEVERCAAYRAYAKAALSAAVDNVRYECGFGGGRWSTDEGAHFGWCMGLSSTSDVPLGPFSVPLPDAWQKAHGQATAKAGARAQEIAQCKATHVPRDCKSCHGGSSKVSTAPVRVSPAALRAMPARGTSSGGSDQVRRGAADPCGSQLKPCKPASRGSSNSAIDRLSVGDGMQPIPSGGGQRGGGSARKPPAGGAASSATPGSGSSTIDVRGMTRTAPMIAPSPGGGGSGLR
jgi:hypothetical protein